MMSKELLLQKKELLDIQLKSLEAKRTKIYNQLTKIQENEDQKIINNWKGTEKDWEWVLDASSESSIKYKFMRNKFEELKLWNGGVWSQTKQRCIQIIKGYSNLDSLKFIINYLKPFDVKDLLNNVKDVSLKGNFKAITTLTNYSDNSNFVLLINETNDKFIVIDIYERYNNNYKVFKTIDEAYNWICSNLFDDEEKI